MTTARSPVAVGFGQASITPRGPVVLAGFGGRSGLVEEVHDELQVQAVVFRTAEHTLCLLVLDLLLLGPDFADPLRSAVGRALGIPAAQVLPSCTHTHSGPAATRSTRRAGWPVPDGYLDVVVSGAVTAAQAAHERCAPATFGYARGTLPAELSVNRRGLDYDPTTAVLDVRGEDGHRLGSIANVAIHPVALGVTCRAISGDWVSRYREHARAVTDAPAVLLSGALGDVNPARDPHSEPDPGGNWETARMLGEAVGDHIAALLSQTSPADGATGPVARRVLRPRTGLTIPTVLSGVTARRVEVELVEWSLGGIRVVSVPGEAFHRLGRAIEAARRDRVLVAGLSPTWQGYLPDPFGRGYEERMSYGRGFVARVSHKLMEVPEG